MWKRKQEQAAIRGKTQGASAPPHVASDGTPFNYMLHSMREEELAQWRRPSPSKLPDAKSGDYLFQLVTCKSSYMRPSDIVPQWILAWQPSGNDQVPVIRCYGTGLDGESVCVNVYNFAPYLCINAPEGVTPSDVETALNALLVKERRPPPSADSSRHRHPLGRSGSTASLSAFYEGGTSSNSSAFQDPVTRELMRRDAALVRQVNNPSAKMSERDVLRASGLFPSEDTMTGYEGRAGGEPEEHHPVVSVEEVERKIALCFHFGERRLFRVNLRTPNLVPEVRKIIDSPSGLKIRRGVAIHGPTYESSVKFENRFMVDVKTCGSGYVRLPQGGAWRVRRARPDSRCTLEIDADWQSFKGISMEEDAALYERPSRMRALDFDIECVSLTGAFPDPKRDPVTNINLLVYEIDKPNEIIADVGLVLGSVPRDAGREGTQRIFCYETEKEMLDDFGALKASIFDPDVEKHFNGKGFDEPYLYDRALHLGCNNYLNSTRNAKVEIFKRVDKKSSKQTGDREGFLTPSEGRVSIDIMRFIQANYKLRSYSLNAVAEHFLNERKDDVSHKIIPVLWRGSPDDRYRLYKYCRKDTALVKELTTKLQTMQSTFELCRIQGVQLEQQQEAGATLKTFVAFLRAFQEAGYVLPFRNDLVKPDYEGAYVVPPVKGYHGKLVGVLDFSSLYPSQIVGHNLCYSTYIRPEDVDDVAELLGGFEANIERCPNGHHYLRKHVRQGIIPALLTRSLAARSVVKKAAAAAKDAFTKSVYTVRELAIKLFNNSVYGYLGRVSNGACPWQLADSTTAYGRAQLHMTMRLVEQDFRPKEPFPADILQPLAPGVKAREIIYGDTDSVLIRFNELEIQDRKDAAEVKRKIELVIKQCKEIGAFCTGFFDKPNSLEFENVYLPLILFSKKRYVGLFWQNGDKWTRLKERGIESVRRDGCLYLTRTLKHCMDLMLKEGNPAQALADAKAALIRLREGRVGIEDLVQSAQIKDLASYKTKVAAVVVAKKMEARSPGNGPKAGDRVPFLVVRGDGKKAKRIERVEDPLYVLNHGVPIDYEYYVEKQMMKPLTRLFKPIFGEEKTAAGLSLKGVRLHLTVVSEATPTVAAPASGLDRFFTQKRDTCLACGVAPSGGCRGMLCTDCEPMRMSVFLREQAEHRQLSIEYSRLWTQCQDCQGTHFRDVETSCGAYDCSIFFKRVQVKKDFQSASKRLDRLSNDAGW